MKSIISAIALALVLVASDVAGFSTTSTFSGSQISSASRNNNGLVMEYIPSGMSKEQWKKMKDAEKNKNKGKNLGAVGVTTFKSRSFSDWQKSGGKNLFPGTFSWIRLNLYVFLWKTVVLVSQSFYSAMTLQLTPRRLRTRRTSLTCNDREVLQMILI